MNFGKSEVKAVGYGCICPCVCGNLKTEGMEKGKILEHY